jgi:hypothetical protein
MEITEGRTLALRQSRGRKLRRLATAAMAFAIALCGTATVARSQEIVIHLEQQGVVPEKLMWEAESGTANIFKMIGLRVAWKSGKHAELQGCSRVINMAIVPSAPERIPPGVLASAHLESASIVVYYDRIEPTIQVWPGLASALLSNVFAHEIAHVLQSLNRHSDTGILKAHWTRDDFLMMLTHRLSFTPLDVGLIRSGIADACGNFGSTD